MTERDRRFMTDAERAASDAAAAREVAAMAVDAAVDAVVEAARIACKVVPDGAVYEPARLRAAKRVGEAFRAQSARMDAIEGMLRAHGGGF